MEKIILTGTVILALAGASMPSARAGDREWATVGKAQTGVAVAGLIVAATDSHAQCNVSYSYGVPAYCPPAAPSPVIVYPAPVMVYPSHRWVRYERWHDCW
jgi:hypothetical protein